MPEETNPQIQGESPDELLLLGDPATRRIFLKQVVERAREVLRTGVPAMTEFDTRRRFGCHGAIEIFVERADTLFLASLPDDLGARHLLAQCRDEVATIAFPRGEIDMDTAADCRAHLREDHGARW